jgi:hypothetical protein
MFPDALYKKYNIDENDKLIGKIEANSEILKNNQFIRPFIRDNSIREIVKIGSRDYEKLDNYIIESLNDYYNRLICAEDVEKDPMLQVYQRLYSMWQEIHNHKLNYNLKELDNSYDLLTYELYVLGYNEEKQIEK